jgi:superfamily I DNA and RNA helicase
VLFQAAKGAEVAFVFALAAGVLFAGLDRSRLWISVPSVSEAGATVLGW